MPLYGEKTMQVVRKIQTADSDHISLKIPKAFMKRSLEIIIMPIDDIKTPSGGAHNGQRIFLPRHLAALQTHP